MSDIMVIPLSILAIFAGGALVVYIVGKYW